MPPISGMSYVTLTGTFLNLQSGGPSVGMVRFSMPFQLVNTTTDEIIVPSDFSATLDVNGSFSISLPATDDPDFLPDDRYWRVTEAVDGKNRDYAILLPASPSTQDLADIAPVEPTEPNAVYTLLPDVAELAASVSILETEVENVLTHGAIGNGSDDDTEAIQAAFDAVATTGKAVFFPAGIYVITQTIEILNRAALTVQGPKSGLIGGTGNMRGAWIRWNGDPDEYILHLDGVPNVDWSGVGFHSVSALGCGVQIDSDNDPVVTNHAWQNFSAYQLQIFFDIGSGASTQSDQMAFRDIRTSEIHDACFRCDSNNVTSLLFERVATGMVNGGGTHYDLLKANLVKLDTCNGGLGVDYVKLGLLTTGTVLDNAQCEGQTGAFLLIGDNADVGSNDTTRMVSCTPDGPVILAGPSRRLLSEANNWHSGSSLLLTGDDSRVTSIREDLALATVGITGTNAQLRRLDFDRFGLPTLDEHFVGEIEWETLPATTGYLGRVCTVAGTPGTWAKFGWITKKANTASRPTLAANDIGVLYLDTTLDADGKPIWWTGTAWVDATGAVV